MSGTQTSPRGLFMEAAKASLAAMHPHRVVQRGIPDLAKLGNEALKQGVISLIAEGTNGWTQYTGREGEYGTLEFAVLVDGLAMPDPENLDPDLDQAPPVELLEEQFEAELLAWVQAIKPEPLNAIYPVSCTYSGGLEAPNAWIVMKLQALYV